MLKRKIIRLLGEMIRHSFFGAARPNERDVRAGRAAPGSAALRFFTAKGTGAVKELNPLHPLRSNLE